MLKNKKNSQLQKEKKEGKTKELRLCSGCGRLTTSAKSPFRSRVVGKMGNIYDLTDSEELPAQTHRTVPPLGASRGLSILTLHRRGSAPHLARGLRLQRAGVAARCHCLPGNPGWLADRSLHSRMEDKDPTPGTENRSPGTSESLGEEPATLQVQPGTWITCGPGWNPHRAYED